MKIRLIKLFDILRKQLFSFSNRLVFGAAFTTHWFPCTFVSHAGAVRVTSVCQRFIPCMSIYSKCVSIRCLWQFNTPCLSVLQLSLYSNMLRETHKMVCGNFTLTLNKYVLILLYLLWSSAALSSKNRVMHHTANPKYCMLLFYVHIMLMFIIASVFLHLLALPCFLGCGNQSLFASSLHLSPSPPVADPASGKVLLQERWELCSL